MADATQIRPHMTVLGSDGGHVGTVDAVEGNRIKLTKRDAADQHHHYLDMGQVARVDSAVHLNTGVAAALAGAGAAAGTAAAGDAGTGESLLPPVKNRAVDHAVPRKNFYLPWIVGVVGVILLLLLLRSCFERDPAPSATDTGPTTAGTTATTALPVEAVALPNGQSMNLEPQTLNYELQRYLASSEATPRTFQFDKLNFDTGSATVRAADRGNVDALAQILAAYPAARVRIVGYTDARGAAPANDQLGQQRATAVMDALVAKGVARERIEAASGGEANPTSSNADAAGQFENRRTELVVLAK